MRDTAQVIREACRGVVQFLLQVQTAGDALPAGNGSANGKAMQQLGFKQRVAAAVRDMQTIDWLVPPMLQKKS